jgi:hypothetical protein
MSKLTIRFHELACPVRGVVEDQDQDVFSKHRNIWSIEIPMWKSGRIPVYQSPEEPETFIANRWLTPREFLTYLVDRLQTDEVLLDNPYIDFGEQEIRLVYKLITDSPTVIERLNKAVVEGDGNSYVIIKQRPYNRIQWCYEHVVETPEDLVYVPPRPAEYDDVREEMSFTFKKSTTNVRCTTDCVTYERCHAIKGSEGYYQGLPFYITFDSNSRKYDEELGVEKVDFALTARYSDNDEPIKQIKGYSYYKPDDADVTVMFRQPLLGQYSKRIESCFDGWKPQEVKVLGDAIINAYKNSIVSCIYKRN